jgi:hypothetical protein
MEDIMTNPGNNPKPASSRQFDNSKTWRLIIVVAFVLAGAIVVLASISKRSDEPAVVATPAPATGVPPMRETNTGQTIPPAKKQ